VCISIVVKEHMRRRLRVGEYVGVSECVRACVCTYVGMYVRVGMFVLGTRMYEV
jgi:hypothetical protein